MAGDRRSCAASGIFGRLRIVKQVSKHCPDVGYTEQRSVRVMMLPYKCIFCTLVLDVTYRCTQAASRPLIHEGLSLAEASAFAKAEFGLKHS